jgi:hypothetical protein
MFNTALYLQYKPHERIQHPELPIFIGLNWNMRYLNTKILEMQF